jgi:hypothetical protein
MAFATQDCYDESLWVLLRISCCKVLLFKLFRNFNNVVGLIHIFIFETHVDSIYTQKLATLSFGIVAFTNTVPEASIDPEIRNFKILREETA